MRHRMAVVLQLATLLFGINSNTLYASPRSPLDGVNSKVFHIPENSANGTRTYLSSEESNVAPTQRDDRSLLQLAERNEGDPNSKLTSPTEVKLKNPIVARRSHRKQQSLKDFLQLIPAHIQERIRKTLTGDGTNFAVESRSDNNVCSEMGCSDGQNTSLIVGLVVTSALLLVAIVVITILVLMMRKGRKRTTRKKSLEGFQNHYANKLANGMGSHHSSTSSSTDQFKEKDGQSHRNELSSIFVSNNTMSTSPANNERHRSQNGISRYHRNQKAQRTEDSPSIAPYHSFSGADTTHRNQTSFLASNHGWENFEIPAFIEHQQISIDQEVHRTQHKRVHRGLLTMHNGHVTKCLVKVYFGSCPAKRHLSADFTAMNEVLNVRSCTQINLVKFFGCCLHSESLYAVNEFVQTATDLRSALRNSRMPEPPTALSSFSGSQLSNFALGIADGLRYLHGHGVAHGCVCGSQILFTEHMVPKLKGCCGKNNFRLRKQKCIRWAAPEVVTSKEYLLTSDVWSYAIVVWEIATLGGLPYPTVPEKSVKNHIQSFRSGDVLFTPCKNVVRRLWTILQSCWEIDANNRPSISDVYKKLAKLRDVATSIFVSPTPGYDYAPTAVVRRHS